MSDRYPEPSGVDAAREANSTTLKQCGWCEYAMGTHRYTYCIEGRCNLLDYHVKTIHWDYKCALLNVSKGDIDVFIKSHLSKIEDSKNNIKLHESYIEVLKNLKHSVTCIRPLLPNNRSADHFNIGDDMAIWLKLYRKWYFGKVVPGYRHHDGCVSYVLEGVGPQTSSFWGCGYAIPHVMLKKEYDYFKENPEQYELWLDNCSENFERAPLG